MGKNKRRSYEEYATDGKAEAKACAVCGCRHFDVYRKDATGKVLKRICRNCGTVVVEN